MSEINKREKLIYFMELVNIYAGKTAKYVIANAFDQNDDVKMIEKELKGIHEEIKNIYKKEL